ncbi:ABC transporter family protein [Mycobacterium xenopi 3993]|nr:ABC transporter family protein [Mycobacterium xenopi 3993]
MMAGLEKPSNGDARAAPDISVGLLPQEPVLDENKSVLDNVRAGVADTEALLARYTEITARLADDCSDELLTEMGSLQEQLDHRGAWDLDSRLEQAMDALRCPPSDADVRDLSGGERRRVALCRLLLAQPDLLLLDEPTNHLDAESVQWLELHLADYPGTVVAVTHDRYFLDNVAQWILELDRATLTLIKATTPPTSTPRPPDCRSKDARTPSGCVTCSASWNGFAREPRPGRRKAVHGFAVTRKWRRRPPRPVALTSTKSTFHPVQGWAAW